jgi:predicted small metal-binding protein
MTEQAPNLQYRCLEGGCGWTTEAGSEEELVEVVGRHMAETHDTFELEEVIIDNAMATTQGTSVESAGSRPPDER